MKLRNQLCFCVFALLLGSPFVAAQEVPTLAGLATLKQGSTRRVTSANPDWREGQDDWTSVQPGQTLVMADLEGPGVITHLWNTINSQEPGHPRLLRLRIYWDGEADPSVDCPLGDFFAGGHGMNIPLDSAVVRVTSNGRARNCYWPMPFRKSARITLTNEGRRGAAVYYYVDYQKLDSLPDDSAYFHAEYRQSFPAPEGKNYVIADIEGRGQYVGTVLSVYSLAKGWWGEGDDLFFIDGASEPTLRGTGTEDYFCDAWGFVQQSGLYYGTPFYGDIQTPISRHVAYRWHLPDPITFDSALRFEIEHRGVVWREDGTIVSHTGERTDDFSSVAFWYQLEPHKPFTDMPVGYARLGFDTTLTLDCPPLLQAASASAGVIEADTHTHHGGRDVEDVQLEVLKWTPGADEQTLTIAVGRADIPITGITVSARRSPDGGIYGVIVDGQPIGQTIDFFNPAIQVGLVQLTLPKPLPPGEHELRLVGHGKAEPSTGHAAGLDAILIQVRPRK